MASWPYTTKRWARLRLLKLHRDPCCELCAPRVVAASQVDHIVAINDGGAVWAPDNLRSCCASCHSTKTRYTEQLRRPVPVRGCDPVTGLPLDPHHDWNRSEKLLRAADRRPPGRLAADLVES